MMIILDGLELLLYFGLDMVELDGKLFDVLIKIGDKVKVGMLLVIMDFEVICVVGKKVIVIIVVINMDKVVNIEVNLMENVMVMDIVVKIMLS